MEGGGFEAPVQRNVHCTPGTRWYRTAIAPFNYPVEFICIKDCSSFDCGNVVLFKPPTKGLSQVSYCQGFDEAGIPAGVLNTITGCGSEIEIKHY